MLLRGEGGLPPYAPVPKPVQAALVWKRPLEFLDWCRDRCGDRFMLYTPPWGDTFYTAVPDDIRSIFTGDQTHIHAGEAFEKIFARVMGPNALFVIDDEHHMRLRRMTLPPFHGESVRRFRDLFAELAAQEVDRWPVGHPFKVVDAMQRLTLEIIIRAMFGDADPVRLAELRQQIPRVIDPGVLIQLGWVVKPLEKTGPWKRHQEFVAAVQQTIVDEMPARRADPRLDERLDVFSMFLRARDQEGQPMSDEELLDEIMTMFVAGIEATAVTIAWAFERLMRHPDKLERLRAELRDGREEYLDAVVKETQRLLPAVFNVPRILARDMEIGGYHLKKGRPVFAAMSAIQRNPAYFPEPLEFRPERWLEGKAQPYTWFPFGGGTRRCLGSSFATAEVKTTIATVLRRVDLQATDPRPERVRTKHITTWPERGAEAVITRRLVPIGAPADALDMSSGATYDVDPSMPARA